MSPPDPFPSSVARVATDGTLEIDGKAAAAQTLVANVSGSSVALEGRVVARPRDGLVAYRIPAGAHVHWLARGLAPDGWTAARFRYQAWPIRPGRYELTLAAPRGTRTIRLAGRRLVLQPGPPRHFTIPTTGRHLELNVNVPNVPLGGRVLGVKVLAVRFVPSSQAGAADATPAASRRASALSVRSQVKSRSSRPKWP
jgi:hypothetical protein